MEESTRPPVASAHHVIREGDCAVLKRDEVFKAVVVLKRRKMIFEKQWFYLDNAIGQIYGTTFEVTSSGSLQPKKKVEETTAETKEAGTDNRNIVDDGKSQKLTHDDIKALKDKGIKGQEIVQQLIENSTTFRDKTEFAQDKYIKKKKKKYEAIITIIKPSTRILSTMYYAREPGKINHLRYDTLAQMLTWGNVRAGNKMIVMETCAGLVLGAVMERMGGYGSIIQMYPGEAPVRTATSCFGFPESFFNTLYGFPLSKVKNVLAGTFSLKTLPPESEENTLLAEESNGSLDDKQLSVQEAEMEYSTERPLAGNQPADQREVDIPAESEAPEDDKAKGMMLDKQKKQEERRKKLIETAALLKDKNADGLIVASRFHPTPLLLSLLEFVAPSRPFVVYCQYKEPLLECYTKLKEKGGVVNLKLSETWLRNYQVLPDRSHPKLMMSGGGGYLLTGINVVNENLKTDDYSEQKAEEPTSKKRKFQDRH
ncbi:tRNA (adenine(58)-N(1))-methyltransferase non-catalytic subunit TRM6 isoform X2 [Hemicordylus capensis]|uniref:tRNA (adenine(58)-N(1))-methyltransferase non-catalytic subunit TRM6 isoform X2 n=1 Tax=Hemicordylus capensis TaxID=884348 RepID=UPI0023033DB8|nr:tRNA (adenine(58)-N(1))-methyltransferase non-catalytic subunit TRM6 isoform X2 [Hemicordylus capensis]